MPANKTLWELLWDYDPNGLVAVDAAMTVKVVNPAFCRMFRVPAETVLGTPAGKVLGDLADFQSVRETGRAILGKEKSYPHLDLHVRQVIFTIEGQDVTAGIMVDLSHERQQRQEFAKLKQETVAKVRKVVANQMQVAQEIASLLGETTAETKASLLKLVRVLEEEGRL